MISLSNSNSIAGLPASLLSGGAPPVNPDFVSTWDTTQAGSASDTVVLPLLSGGTYSGTIDWGDGGATSVLSYANRTHVYASSGTYTITISGTTLQGWTFQNAGDKAKITGISNWGIFDFSETRTFQGCVNMDITATDVPTISTTDFTSNFYNCDGITTVQNWSVWDMSGVTNYTLCFAENSGFNGNLGGWVHSGTTNVSKMFNNATAFNGNLNTWDVSGVTNWTEFARGATSFNGDVSGWVVNGAMTSAFLGCSSFVGNGCSTWDVSGMTSASSLFSQCVLFSDNISGWDTSSCTNMTSMLRNCDAFNRDISTWDINQVSAFANFMTDATGLETALYDALLIAWDAQGAMSYSGTVNFGGSRYTSGGAAEAAHISLEAKWGTIVDGGPV